MLADELGSELSLIKAVLLGRILLAGCNRGELEEVMNASVVSSFLVSRLSLR